MPNKPNIILVCIDCLRADKIFSSNLEIPNIRFLMNNGTAFQKAFAVTATTTPAITSILTGLYPVSHGLLSLTGYKLNEGIITLPEYLKQIGYSTMACLSGPLTKETGIHKWFDEYHYRDRNVHYSLEWRSSMISSLERQQNPYMAFLHFWEMHEPRFIPKDIDFKLEGKSDYEKALSLIDNHIGEVLNKINLENTVFVLFGDHGESIADDRLKKLLIYGYSLHPKGRRYIRNLGTAIDNIRKLLPFGVNDRYAPGFLGKFEGHGYHIFDFLTNIPLIISGGDVRNKGSVIKKLVSQVDITPTILDIIGKNNKNASPNEGRSLLPLIRDDNNLEWEQLVFLQASGITLTDEEQWLIGLRTPRWKFACKLNNPSFSNSELYDLVKDKLELRNVATQNPTIVKNFLLKIRTFTDSLKRNEMSQEEKNGIEGKLKQLGYL